MKNFFRKNKEVLNIVLAVFLIKITLIIVGIIAINTFPFEKKNYDMNFHFPKKENRSVSYLKTWDAQHYLFIAKFGYKENNESNRFFPLYPLAIWLFNNVIHNLPLSGLIVSNLFSILSAILLYKIVIIIFNNRAKAFWSVFFLFAFPTAFFLSAIYSESLFIFLILLFFYLIQKKKLLLSLIPAFLLPLSRPNGIFIILPLLTYIFLTKKHNLTFNFPTFNKPIKILFPLDYFLLIVPVLGIGFYFLLMYFFLKDPFAGFSGHALVSTWDPRILIDPASIVKNLFSANLVLHGFGNSIIDRVFFVLFLISLPFVYQKVPKPFFVYSLCIVLTPFLGSFMSYTRYVLMAFPVFIMLASYLDEDKYIGVRYSVVALFLMLQSIFFSMFILNYWVA